jgi:hypothetical protein
LRVGMQLSLAPQIWTGDLTCTCIVHAAEPGAGAWGGIHGVLLPDRRGRGGSRLAAARLAGCRHSGLRRRRAGKHTVALQSTRRQKNGDLRSAFLA